MNTQDITVEKAKKMANDTTRYIDGDAVLIEYMYNEATLEAVLKQAQDDVRREVAAELRKYWSFDGYQQHTHSWHDREDYIENHLTNHDTQQ